MEAGVRQAVGETEPYKELVMAKRRSRLSITFQLLSCSVASDPLCEFG